MGVCASKEAPTAGSSTTRKPVQRTGPQRKEPTVKNTPKPVNKAATKKKKLGGDEVLGEGEPEKLSPREAARLAAEKRAQETQQKNTKGELGKKLEQEKSKSHKAKVLEEAEQRKAEHERLQWD
ncbi:Uncharacterized protein RNJ44_01456 [Nakaseomyces bracarensis]|uniref:Uncharacterized protein n=1 Tax=Nakaseomyces bracarensis TaxID=273131 RepID=A0ABR4NPR6_9SACH